uniref:Zinc knuckle CX2CX4HX4C n=1 Tax=Tanacetum cinerariifolium TaxID=118510 RepID=A0A699GSM5_TANCI|nr:hypothetical protein [Tanacetum cinerariifolium]
MSQKGSGRRRGVKEKDLNRNVKNTTSGIGVSMDSDDTMNADTPSGGASVIQDCVTPSVVEMMGKLEKQNALDDNTILESFPLLSTPITTEAGSALSKSSYANVTCKPSGKKLNIRTLFTPGGRSSYAKVMIELRADVDLKDNIIVAMPKITREGHNTCNVHVEYEWKPPRCSSCKVFGHFYKECLKNTCVGEKKSVKKHNQTSRGVLVGPKIGFKPYKEYQPVPKNPNASLSEFGTNGGTTNLANNEANSSGSSFINIDNKGEFASNTPISEKIDKIKRQICKGKLRLLDNDGNPLVPTGIVESDSEVEVVFDETANLRISTSGKDRSDKGYGTNSLLEQ